MTVRMFGVPAIAGGLLFGLCGGANSQEIEDLEVPADVAVCQVDYPAVSSTGEGHVRVSWNNPEMYEAVEFAVDDVVTQPVAAGDGDGADGRGTVTASPGQHSFGVRGRLGDRVSPWVNVEFEVLESSPIPEPVADLDCELIPVMGGMLRLTWQPGADAWTSGELTFAGAQLTASIGQGATSVEALTPSSPGVGSDTVTAVDEVVLVFKNDAGYTSPQIRPSCSRRTPTFRRGDCNGDARVNISDPIFNLNHLFIEGERGFCDDACDANDDGILDLSDAVATLNFLFAGEEPPRSPGPVECGIDATEDFLGGLCSCP